ncbi:GNAT family N-acetyltransferase [Burkholderia ubonensis]|uniref:GNAT family N-acetyltransferase n=1 Tax=Burkholderia ubonensis TaxID=101571 RepID=UPI000754134C|nr:GNAT family N-acetyltransferase [Burkholderia ubonensis]KVD20361.1 GCN5 family acetyltransferase [Burkholderia ubonensis]KWC54808.1 GCN5 family acetyltransferase [Burkholderia ubonensis]
MTDITIRHSETKDIDAIRQIAAHPAVYANTLQAPFPSPEKWQERIEGIRQKGFSLVAEIDGEVVGHLGIQPEANPRRRHVAGFGLMVKASHHGRGIGSRLLAAMIDLAENWLNVTRIELTVFADNRSAIALYERHGFRIEGESPDFALRDGVYVAACHMARLKRDAGPAAGGGRE